jgi:hypothetical protein
MADTKDRSVREYHTKGLKYFGQELNEISTEPQDENWQYVRIRETAYPRRCVRIEGDKVLVSIACLESEPGEERVRYGLENIESQIGECEFFYVTDADGHPIEWKIKRER